MENKWRRVFLPLGKGDACIHAPTHCGASTEDPHGLMTGIQEWFLSGEKLYGFLGGEGCDPLVREAQREAQRAGPLERGAMVWKLVDSIALRLADVGGLVLRRVLGLSWDYSGSGIDLLSRRGGMTDHAMEKNGELRGHMFNFQLRMRPSAELQASLLAFPWLDHGCTDSALRDGHWSGHWYGP
ncbi:hypothetical protein BGZ61DRAFT_185020 [Ilyonectria robusta]|uniref:uncharacterized protein n=1 Tax=Ilyonectria robusta TaxID=1079257 RepID=UPI001E8E674A|nr:uncharacterized protein BGZ61DRAFT_185020 [Ilyonectria robusta]KAH8729623.1 hypothetical protein BGZ61DRAFT_185020 [Ilyonectria robusta]